MATTYLDLTNELLRELNEVTLTTTNFFASQKCTATCKR